MADVGADLMPAYSCHHPTCTEYVRERGGLCPEHATTGKTATAERHQFYDQHRRDPEAKAFYNSAAWKRARAIKLAREPVCEKCGEHWAEHVHHVRKVKTHPELRLDQSNLKSVCAPCHNAIEAEATDDVH